MHAFSVGTTALGKDHHHHHHTVQVTILRPITAIITTTAQAAMHEPQSLRSARVFTRVLATDAFFSDLHSQVPPRHAYPWQYFPTFMLPTCCQASMVPSAISPFTNL